MPIRSFLTEGTQDINHGRNTRLSRQTLPLPLHEKARVKLARLHAAESLLDLATLPGNRLEKLKGHGKGQRSIRINDQYRICFYWQNDAAEKVEIVDYP